MNKMKKLYLLMIAAGLMGLSATNLAKEITLTSLDWPPFTSPNIPGGGNTTIIVKKALELEGYELNIEFEPWETAVSRAMNDKDVAGYFPEYYSSALDDRCVFSDAIGSSMVVFANRKGERYPSRTLADWQQHTIGVVAGYVNEEKFDAAVAEGKVPVKESVDDVHNLMNLLDGRVDLAVIDTRVMNYWLMKNKALHAHMNEVRYNPGGLKMHGLYVCFTGDEAQEHAAALARGLKALDPMGFGLQNDPMYKHSF